MPDFPGDNEFNDPEKMPPENGPYDDPEPQPESNVEPTGETPPDSESRGVLAILNAEPNRDEVKPEPVPEKPQPTFAVGYDRDLVQKIFLAEQEIGMWDARIEEAAEGLKAMKASREASVAALRRLCREINESTTPNLFNVTLEGEIIEADFVVAASPEKKPEASEKPKAYWTAEKVELITETVVYDGFEKPPEKDTTVVIEGSDDSWRDVPLSDLIDLGAPELVIERLGEIGITTIGQFADWGEPNAQGFSKNIENQKLKGCGPGKREKFEQAMEEFWKRRSGVAF